MDTYIDITPKPSEETPPPIVLGMIFTQIHLELVKQQINSVGVSFPNADRGIGDQMRLHGPSQILSTIANALVGFSDYCQISPPKAVPEGCEWRVISRVQPRISAAKVRRMIKRGSISERDAQTLIDAPKLLSLPYLQISSQSTGQKFKIFFNQKPAERPAKSQTFNTYGTGGIVPWF